MIKHDFNKAFNLFLVVLLLGLVAFSSVSAANHTNFDVDVTSVEVELADLDIDETNTYQDLLHFTLNDIWASMQQSYTRPITFSSSTGFHSNTSTGKSICIVFGQLKFDC